MVSLSGELERILAEAAHASLFQSSGCSSAGKPMSPMPIAREVPHRRSARRIAAKFAAQAGTVYLLSPDLHVCARWLEGHARHVSRALAIAACLKEPRDSKIA